MQRTVSAQEARQRLGELLEGVYYRDDEVVIERAGKPMGVVIPMSRYETMRAARERFWQMFDELREQESQLSDEEAMALAIEEVRAYRQDQSQAMKESDKPFRGVGA